MNYYDPELNPFNKYKIRNVIKSMVDSENFITYIAIIGFIAIIIHQIL